MIEQWAVDNGRSQNAWLMGGLPEQDTSLLQARRSDIRPYSRLAEPTWVAAQVAYLRDVEFLENRLKNRATGSGNQGLGSGEVGEEDDESGLRPRRPRKPKGGDKPTPQ